MTVYKFNTLPLYKKEWVFMVPWEKVEKNAGILKKNWKNWEKVKKNNGEQLKKLEEIGKN